MKLEHVLPQIGPVSIELYEPADHIYQLLREQKEVNRLGQLRQLGALSITFEGARLARWDYTLALLYYSSKLRLKNFNSKYRIGRVRFSSTLSALQCASLIWNLGHIPGTFSTEKGVYRFLFNRDPDNPVGDLAWPFTGNADVESIKEKATKYVLSEDYLGLSRVLAVIKLLGFCEDADSESFGFVVDFAAPLLLDYEGAYSKQWRKIKRSFALVRHLAYLTVDLPFCGHHWAPNIPELLNSHLVHVPEDIEVLVDNISELLSPLEKKIYDSLYHSDKARIETTIFSDHTFKKLTRVGNYKETIKDWTHCGLSRDLSLGRRIDRKKIKRSIEIKLRSHFSGHPDSAIQIENKLRSLNFSHAAVFEYKAWNSDALLEPDERIIDIMLDRDPTANDIGVIINWYIKELDNLDAKPDDYFDLTRKAELGIGYKQLLSKAVQLQFPDILVKLEPWSLNRFGLFPDYYMRETLGGIWACRAKMDDSIAKHLLRDRTRYIVRELQDAYAELKGISALRKVLRERWKASAPRCRWLIITSSIQFYKEGRNLMEYDGGLLRISSRNGKLTWYGIESKNGAENPATTLRRKLKVLGVKSEVKSIDATHAYVELGL